MNFVFYLHDVASLKEAEDTLLYFRSKYTIIPSTEISKVVSEGGRGNHVVLTIDDGWRSTYDYFFPICKKYNIPVTIFVSPQVAKTAENLWFYKLKYCNESKVLEYLVDNYIFEKSLTGHPVDLALKELTIDKVNNIIDSLLESQLPRGFCNIEELREMHKSGLVTIGAHTMIHPILSNETDERSEYEIKESIKQLEDILQDSVTTFAYPNGLYGVDFGEREKKVCRENGIKKAFSVDPGVLGRNMDWMSIPRCGSINRLKLGRLGMILPSLYNQAGKRESIRKKKVL